MADEFPDYLKEPTNVGYKYGDLYYRKGRFILSGEPVMMEFAKRVFPGAQVGGYRRTGKLSFGRSSREVSDLNWMMMRFPLNVHCKEYLDKARDTAIDRWFGLATGNNLKPTTPPSEFLGKLYPYQEEAVTFMTSNKRVLLGDSMGLGKTWSALGAVAQSKMYPCLVVCQAHVQLQWQRAIGSLFDMGSGYQKSLFDTDFDISIKRGKSLAPILKGRTSYRIPRLSFSIIHYGLIAWWEEELLANRFKTVIFDEIQELRHSDTKKYSTASLLSGEAEHVYGLSVGGESIIELYGDCFGDGWVGPIEEAYSIISNEYDKLIGDNVFVGDKNIFSRGWNGNGFTWNKVDIFYRHNCTSNTRSIFAGGTELVITDDHSIFKATEKGIDCIKSCDLDIGDTVIVDNGLNWNNVYGHERHIDIVKIMSNNKRTQVIVDLDGINRKDLLISPQQWYKYKNSRVIGNRIPVSIYNKYKDILPDPQGLYLAPSRAPRICDAKIMISDIAYVLGFFLGDGWIDGNDRIAFSVEKSLLDCFLNELNKIKFIHIEPSVMHRKRGSVEVRFNSVIFVSILKYIFGGNKKSFEKRIPGSWIISWSRNSRLELLRGMIDSDGSISRKNGRIYYCTTSKIMSLQLMSLLRSIGVKSGYFCRDISDGGIIDGKRVKGRRKSYVINWSGHAMRGNFDGYYGDIRSLSWSKNIFNEGKVRRISEINKPKYVYDIGINGYPAFVANGIMVHNSGTPIYGYGSEIWSVTNAVDFNCLGSQEAFGREWCDGYGSKVVKEPKALHGHMVREGLLLRRKYDDVMPDLPKVIRRVQDLEQDDELYEQLIETAKRRADVWLTSSFTEKGRLAREIEGETRQAAGIAKAKYVAEFVASLIEAGEKPLVYAWHHAVHNILRETLARYEPSFITGKQTQAQKDRAIRKFVNGDNDIVILSLRSASGIDGLQYRATCCVFAELDWSPAVHGQSETRIARIGVDSTVKEVPAYYCVSRSGFDEIILDVLGVKKGQFLGLMGDEPEDEQEEYIASQRIASRIKLLVEKLTNG